MDTYLNHAHTFFEQVEKTKYMQLQVSTEPMYMIHKYNKIHLP